MKYLDYHGIVMGFNDIQWAFMGFNGNEFDDDWIRSGFNEIIVGIS